MHQELIDFVSTEFKLGENSRQFLQKMREYRNRISYEGFRINKNYIKSNDKIIASIMDTLIIKIG